MAVDYTFMTEAHRQVKNGNVLRFARNYWFIIVFICGAAVAWSEIRGQVTRNTTNIEESGIILKALELKYVQDISVIKTKLDSLYRKSE